MGVQAADEAFGPVLVQKSSNSYKKAVLLAAGCVLALVCTAAALSAILCTTALVCTVQPLSMAPRTAEQQNQRQRQPYASLESAGADSRHSTSCPVQYAAVKAKGTSADGAPPLLLGGAVAACTTGCQPRSSIWSESCKMDPESHTTWGLCTMQQRPMMVQLANQLSNGSMLNFSPCDLYELIQGRTLWLIGDSHMKSAYTAIRCLMLDFWDNLQGECAASSDPVQQLQLHKALLFAPRNLTLNEITEPRCVHLIGGGRICFLHTVRGEVLVSGDPGAPGVLELVQAQHLAGNDDIFYTSFGRWYTHDCRWFEASPYNQSLHALADNYKATKGQWPHVFFGVPPFDHTTCDPSFDVKTATSCPVAGSGDSIHMYDQIASYAHDILTQQELNIIDYQQSTRPLNDAHLSSTRTFKNAIDCLHYCRPGLPEMDIWFLYNAMKQKGISSSTRQTSTEQQQLQCTRLKPFL